MGQWMYSSPYFRRCGVGQQRDRHSVEEGRKKKKKEFNCRSTPDSKSEVNRHPGALVRWLVQGLACG